MLQSDLLTLAYQALWQAVSPSPWLLIIAAGVLVGVFQAFKRGGLRSS